MKQFEAAQAFYNLLQKHPEDFSATAEQLTRVSTLYTIRHLCRSVVVKLEVDLNDCISVISQDENSLSYVNPELAYNFVQWAKDYVENAKVQFKVQRDNKLLANINEYYLSKELEKKF